MDYIRTSLLVVLLLAGARSSGLGADWFAVGSQGENGNCMAEYTVELGTTRGYDERRSPVCDGPLAADQQCGRDPFIDPNGPWLEGDWRRGDKLMQKQDCMDGDPDCDLDGDVNGCCQFQVGFCFCVEDPTQGNEDTDPGGVCTARRQRQCALQTSARWYDSYFVITRPKRMTHAQRVFAGQQVGAQFFGKKEHEQDTIDSLASQLAGVHRQVNATTLEPVNYLRTEWTGVEVFKMLAANQPHSLAETTAPYCLLPWTDPDGEDCVFPRVEVPLDGSDSCTEQGTVYVPLKGIPPFLRKSDLTVKTTWLNPDEGARNGMPDPCANNPDPQDRTAPCATGADTIDAGGKWVKFRCAPNPAGRERRCANNQSQTCVLSDECGANGPCIEKYASVVPNSCNDQAAPPAD